MDCCAPYTRNTHCAVDEGRKYLRKIAKLLSDYDATKNNTNYLDTCCCEDQKFHQNYENGYKLNFFQAFLPVIIFQYTNTFQKRSFTLITLNS